MEVLLIQDIVNLGLKGEVKKVREGYANNYLLPQKLAVAASPKAIAEFREKKTQTALDSKILGSRVAMLAEHLKNMHITLKEKANEQGKLYGAVGPEEIVEALKEKDILVNRKQIEFPKAIRTIGEYEIIIRLTAKIKPTVTVKIVKA